MNSKRSTRTSFALSIHEQKLISCSIATRELDRRLFGFIKKVASKFLGRELSESELDELAARDFEDELDAYVHTCVPNLR